MACDPVLLSISNHLNTWRYASLRKVAKSVTSRFQFRWVASLSFMGIDADDDNLAEVRQLLSGLIRHRRRVMYILQPRNSAKAQALVHLSPESIVPELVWRVANQPDVESDENHDCAESEKYLLLFFFGQLSESNEYASVRNSYLANVSLASSVPVQDNGAQIMSKWPSSISRRATAAWEKKRAGRKQTMIEYPDEAKLPEDLYSASLQQGYFSSKNGSYDDRPINSLSGLA